MDYFQYGPGSQDDALFAEGVPLEEIARQVGTPTYVYSAGTLRRHVRVLREGLAALPHHICYAIKANASMALMQIIHEEGCGFDAVSIGELSKALKLGAAPSDIILSGVGKRNDEIDAALQCGGGSGVRYICAESISELKAINSRAKHFGKIAPVCVRVNPDVDAKTHPYIATGLKKNKFGVAWDKAASAYDLIDGASNLKAVGLSCHIGSQITTTAPFVEAANKVAELAKLRISLGTPLTHIGVGGGLGIPYQNETPPTPDVYGQAIADVLSPLGLTVLLEPGRVLVGNAGVLLTRVVRTKQQDNREFVIADAGMNDLLRPALYQATHTAVAVRRPRPGSSVESPQTLAGPVCESADTFVDSNALHAKEGDLIALRSAGAYGFVMASTYNGRPTPAEVVVDGSRWQVTKPRGELSELWQNEQTLDGTLFDSASPF